MIRRPPRSTQSRSSAASDVYKRQAVGSVNRKDCRTFGEQLAPLPSPNACLFIAGPAAATSTIPIRGLRSAPKLTGTGLAYPNKNGDRARSKGPGSRIEPEPAKIGHRFEIPDNDMGLHARLILHRNSGMISSRKFKSNPNR